MDIDSAFANPEAEKEGVWIDYRDGSRIKVARLHNPRFTSAYDAAIKPHKRKQRAGTLKTEVETSIFCRCIAKTILLDWEGFEKDGKPWKYSEKNAYDLLQASLDFRNEVTEYSTSEEVFHRDHQEDSAKN